MARINKIRQVPNWFVGLIFVIVLSIGFYVAFTKNVPFTGGTKFEVVFDDAQNLRPNTPLRVAGVEIGKVKSVTPIAPDQSSEEARAQFGDSDSSFADDSLEPGSASAIIEISDSGLPLKEDARFKLRPRLFLEGNLFVEVQPGSPGAPAVEADHVFPPNQTSNSVKLDQIFTGALQKDTRADLQTFLDEFGTALIDEGGAESFQTLYRSSPDAFRTTAQVNEAFLGQNPNDLSGLIGNLDRVVRGLGENEVALQDTVTNLATVTGSLAAQDRALQAAIAELPDVLDAADPAFASLNAAFPSLRAFSREILPGVQSTPDTLASATPLLVQARRLSGKDELRGLVADLRPTIPALARLTNRTIPFLEETRALSSCFNEVLLPFSNDSVEGLGSYPHNTDTPVYKETAYSLVGLNGESRSQDANGQYIRVAGSGGSNTVVIDGAESGETTAGVTGLNLQGAMPGIDESPKTKFKPNAPCENQDAPDLRALGGQPPSQQPSPVAGGSVLPGPPDVPGLANLSGLPANGEAKDISDASRQIMSGIAAAAGLREIGEDKKADKVQTKAEKQSKKFYSEFGN